MTWEEMTSMAAEEGFAAAVVTDTKDIPFDPSFRPLCAENLCGKYGVNYSCPPDCGTPDEMDVPGFPVGASGCALCETCAIVEHEPCRYPDLYYSCMSAYCIFVRRLAEQCGMEYDCGPGLLAFFGMYVFD